MTAQGHETVSIFSLHEWNKNVKFFTRLTLLSAFSGCLGLPARVSRTVKNRMRGHLIKLRVFPTS